MKKQIVAILILGFSLKASAEYRAFELKITDTEKNKERIIISTLDQIQYPRYYPLAKNEIITYENSWMCYDNMSNFKSPCTPLKTNSANNP